MVQVDLTPFNFNRLRSSCWEKIILTVRKISLWPLFISFASKLYLFRWVRKFTIFQEPTYVNYLKFTAFVSSFKKIHEVREVHLEHHMSPEACYVALEKKTLQRNQNKLPLILFANIPLAIMSAGFYFVKICLQEHLADKKWIFVIALVTKVLNRNFGQYLFQQI